MKKADKEQASLCVRMKTRSMSRSATPSESVRQCDLYYFEGGQGTSSATYRHPLGASSEDLVRHCLRLHLRDAVDLLELLEELGLGRVARLLPWAEGVERDLVRVGVRVGRVWSKY